MTHLLRISAANIGPNRFHPDGLVADVNPTFDQQILDIAQRQWVSHANHHDQADDIRRAVETSERIGHDIELTRRPALQASFLVAPTLARAVVFINGRRRRYINTNGGRRWRRIEVIRRRRRRAPTPVARTPMAVVRMPAPPLVPPDVCAMREGSRRSGMQPARRSATPRRRSAIESSITPPFEESLRHRTRR